jgi:hypothetical protein
LGTEEPPFSRIHDWKQGLPEDTPSELEDADEQDPIRAEEEEDDRSSVSTVHREGFSPKTPMGSIADWLAEQCEAFPTKTLPSPELSRLEIPGLDNLASRINSNNLKEKRL